MKKAIVKLAAEHANSCQAYREFAEAEGHKKQLTYAQGKEDSADEFNLQLVNYFLNNPSPVSLITQWSEDRNLIKDSTPKDQCLKLMQEVGELSGNLCKGKDPIDDIGDCITVLNNIALQHGLTLDQCIMRAYNDIKDRKGEMRDGVFIKEADL